MWSLLARFLPFAMSKGLIAGIAAAFLAGASVGGWAAWKLVKAQEADRLAQQLTEQLILHDKELRLMRAKHAADLEIANDRETVREVVKYVPDNRACDLQPNVVGLLDRARRGVPATSGGTDPARTGPAADAGLSQRVEVQAHMDCGLKFRELKVQYDGLRTWICEVADCKP